MIINKYSKEQCSRFKAAISATPVDSVAISELFTECGIALHSTKSRCYDVRYIPTQFEQIHYQVEAAKQAQKHKEDAAAIKRLNKATADSTIKQLAIKSGKKSMSIDEFIAVMERTGYELKVVKKKRARNSEEVAA